MVFQCWKWSGNLEVLEEGCLYFSCILESYVVIAEGRDGDIAYKCPLQLTWFVIWPSSCLSLQCYYQFTWGHWELMGLLGFCEAQQGVLPSLHIGWGTSCCASKLLQFHRGQNDWSFQDTRPHDYSILNGCMFYFLSFSASKEKRNRLHFFLPVTLTKFFVPRSSWEAKIKNVLLATPK